MDENAYAVSFAPPYQSVGLVERVASHVISGWAVNFDRKSLVDLVVDGVHLYSVRSNINRHDIRRPGLNNIGGFMFPIAADLQAVIRSGADLTIRLSEYILPFAPGVACRYPFGSQHDQNVLAGVLEAGFRVSPKHGGLYKPISRSPNFQRDALRSYSEARITFLALFNTDLLLGFGSLLGLYRDGALIPNDDDIDVFFVIKEPTIELFLERYVYIVSRLRKLLKIEMYAGGLHLSVMPGDGVPLDCFVAWYDGVVIRTFHTVLDCVDADLEPKEMVGFPGVFAPAAIEKFLIGWYGPDWRTPDPFFQWILPPELEVRYENFVSRLKSEQFLETV